LKKQTRRNKAQHSEDSAMKAVSYQNEKEFGPTSSLCLWFVLTKMSTGEFYDS
jgi:hypothetical protein